MALAMVSGACLSGSVEFVQLFAPERSPSVVDLVTNTFGSVVGALVGWPLARWIWPVASVRIRQLLLSRPLAACALAATAGVMFAGLLPSYNKLGISGPMATLKTARLIPFGPSPGEPRRQRRPGLWCAELLGWTLVGGLLGLAARESGQHGAFGRSVVWSRSAGGLSLAIEVLQLVSLDVTSTSPRSCWRPSARPWARRSWHARRALMPAAGSCRRSSSGAWRHCWQPGTRRDSPGPIPRSGDRKWFVPFWSYFGSRTLEDLADVIGQAMVFMPLGALLAALFVAAVIPGRRPDRLCVRSRARIRTGVPAGPDRPT